MKTFEEACESVLMRIIKTAEPGSKPGLPEDLIDNSLKYQSMMEQIQDSEESMFLAMVLLASEFEPPMIIRIAFSQGVMVGCEMEKP